MIESQTTEMLIEISRKTNLRTDTEGVLVANMVADVLEKRMSEADFVALMNEHDAELNAAC